MSGKRNISIVLLFLICIAGYYFSIAFNFLSFSKNINPKILIIEGWLQDDVLELAKKEFLQHDYQFILTTGFPHANGFNMRSRGKLVIETGGHVIEGNDGIYDIQLITQGTKAKNVYPHFRLFVDSLEIGDGFSTKQPHCYSKKLKLKSPPFSVSIVFDNDGFTTFRDRNLIVHSLSINDHFFDPNSENVTYYIRRKGVYSLHHQLSNSSAKDAANYLIKAGIPDSLIIPVTTTKKIKSKTYTTALDVKQWLDQNGIIKPRVTIYTKGMHGRRSFISFRKAFGESAEIGVISVPDKKITGKNWWKTFHGWRTLFYETAGVIYIMVVL